MNFELIPNEKHEIELLEWDKPTWPQPSWPNPRGLSAWGWGRGVSSTLGAGGSPVKFGRPTARVGEEAAGKHAWEDGDPIWGFGQREAHWCGLVAVVSSTEGRALVRDRRGARRRGWRGQWGTPGCGGARGDKDEASGGALSHHNCYKDLKLAN
jgi:hypothetical protein